MARPRRTRFAASFVAVVAAGCSHEAPPTTGPGSASASDTRTPTASWHVSKGNDGACWATPHVDCGPPGPQSHTCNPPAAMKVACADPMPADGFQIISFDGKTCVLADGTTSIACPSYDPPPPPDAAPAAAAFTPRRWEITQGDKTCYAELLTFSCPAGATCNPPAPTKVACATYSPGSSVDERAPGQCHTIFVEGGGNCPPKMHCNPPPPRDVDVPCPGSK